MVNVPALPTDWDELPDMLAEIEADPKAKRLFDDRTNVESLLDQLVAERIRLGLSGRDVAEKLRVEYRVVDDLERGVRLPTINQLQGYARAVGKKLTFALEDADN